MSGYDGYSMSNNAVDAYDRGCLPKSKITWKWCCEYKLDLFFENLKVVKEAINKELLSPSEWHHTSKEYNCTNFYDGESLFEQALYSDSDWDKSLMDLMKVNDFELKCLQDCFSNNFEMKYIKYKYRKYWRK